MSEPKPSEYSTLFHYDGLVPVPKMTPAPVTGPDYPLSCWNCGKGFETGHVVTVSTEQEAHRHVDCLDPKRERAA